MYLTRFKEIFTLYLQQISVCLSIVYWFSFMTGVGNYSQLSSCGHPAIRDTLIIMDSS